jgi:hypothetical protein
MSATELTPWLPSHLKPIRIGYYECKFAGLDSPLMRYWDGEWWHRGSDKAKSPCTFGSFSADQWRGLATPARCHAHRDGECSHSMCPQLRDGEPAKSGRHCPIDNWGDE